MLATSTASAWFRRNTWAPPVVVAGWSSLSISLSISAVGRGLPRTTMLLLRSLAIN